MSRERDSRPTLLQLPRIARLEPVHDQRLPDGRALVEVEVAGWGVLLVGRVVRVFWGAGCHRYVVPLGQRITVTTIGPISFERRVLRVAATLAQAPEAVSAPRPTLAAVAAMPRGRVIGAVTRGPRVIDSPVLRVPQVVVKLPEPRPVAVGRLRIPVCRRYDAPAVAVPMPAVRRKALRPPLQHPSD